MNNEGVSVVIPAKNEAATIPGLVQALRVALPGAEVVVVDDGSTDDTGRLAQGAGARVVRHPHSLGNGAAVKTGARSARGEILVCMDADGQHDPSDIPRLLERLEQGYDLVIGARDAGSQASLLRLFGNAMYNWLASWMVGHRVLDLTSGLRAFRRAKFLEFQYLYPNGFSYPATSTICFYRAGYPVAFVPIRAGQRAGRGHIRIVRDGGRFFLIIFRVGTLYAPLKLFFPMALVFFLGGLAYSTYTLFEMGRFTNFGALLFITSILIFSIGLVSEQITNLLYRR